MPVSIERCLTGVDSRVGVLTSAAVAVIAAVNVWPTWDLVRADPLVARNSTDGPIAVRDLGVV